MRCDFQALNKCVFRCCLNCPTGVHAPNCVSAGLAILAAQLMVVTNRHRPRNIGNNRPHLVLCIAMRPATTSARHTTSNAEVSGCQRRFPGVQVIGAARRQLRLADKV